MRRQVFKKILKDVSSLHFKMRDCSPLSWTSITRPDSLGHEETRTIITKKTILGKKYRAPAEQSWKNEAKPNAIVQRNSYPRRCYSTRCKKQIGHIGRKKSNNYSRKVPTRHAKSRQTVVGFNTKSVKRLKISRFNKRISAPLNLDHDQRIENLRIHLREADKANFEKSPKVKYRSVQRATEEGSVSNKKSPDVRNASIDHSSITTGYTCIKKPPRIENQRNIRTPNVNFCEHRSIRKRTKEIYRTLEKSQKIENLYKKNSPKSEHRRFARSPSFNHRSNEMSPTMKSKLIRKTPKLRHRSVGLKETSDPKIRACSVSAGNRRQTPSTGGNQASLEQWLKRIKSNIFDTNERLFGPAAKHEARRMPRRNAGGIAQRSRD